MPTIGVHAIAVINVYLCVNLLLVAAALLLAGIRCLNDFLPQPLSYRHILGIGRGLMIAALLLPPLALWCSSYRPSLLHAEVWSAPSMRVDTAAASARLELPFASPQGSLPLDYTADLVILLIFVGVLAALFQLLRDARATLCAVRRAQPLRRIGRVRVLVSDDVRVPFACWVPGRALVVLPAPLLLRPVDLLLAVRHEAQHHRQWDTRLIHLMQLGRAWFCINPAAHWLLRQQLEIQEFACDEALARRRSHCDDAYCACLLRVAEAAANQTDTLLHVCMAAGVASVLGRRISVAQARPARHLRALPAAILGVTTLAPLLGLSAVLGAPIHDMRLSQTDATRLLSATRVGSGFPREMNAEVLAQLNLLLGTPDGRSFLRASLMRMKGYQTPILTQMRQYGLPRELLAVPLLESGYRNLPAKDGGHGAGLWQFIAPAARRYGLEVSTRRDQRLDITEETDAAMRMLAELRHTFGDWRLALLAYSAGAAHVAQGITTTGSHDAWALSHAGFGNDPGYLSRTMAVVLILDNPRLVN